MLQMAGSQNSSKVSMTTIWSHACYLLSSCHKTIQMILTHILPLVSINMTLENVDFGSVDVISFC